MNLLTAAGTVCKRICGGFVELVPIVCVTGPDVAVPTRNNWNPFSVFKMSAGVCPGVSVLNVIYNNPKKRKKRTKSKEGNYGKCFVHTHAHRISREILIDMLKD